MKEHVQEYGVRKWSGDDLVELQSESLAAIQETLAPYAPCILRGCEVTNISGNTYRIAPGLVLLSGNDADGAVCTKIVRFGGSESTILPIYLTLGCETSNRVYGDNKNKPVAHDYTALASIVAPPADTPRLVIADTKPKRLPDTLGISEKLKSEGGEAKNVKVGFSQATARTGIASGSTLGTLMGNIAKWFADLKALAFKDKVAKADFDTQLTTDFDNKVDKVSGKGLSTNDFTTALKTKLDGIAASANNYTHPGGAGNTHIPTGGSAGQHLTYGGSSGVATWGPGGLPIATLQNLTTKKFLLNPNGYFINEKINHSEYAVARLWFYAAKSGYITFSCRSYGEQNCDYGIIGNVDVALALNNTPDNTAFKRFGSSASYEEVRYDNIPAGYHYIDFKYRKDGSVDSGDDRFQFKIAASDIVDEIVTQGAPLPPTATASASGLMPASDKSKLDGIAAGAQVNPSFATTPSPTWDTPIPSTLPGNYLKAEAITIFNQRTFAGSSDTVARGDHEHTVYIPDATTSKGGMMTAADKSSLDKFTGAPKVIYACKFIVNDDKTVSKYYEKAVPGMTVVFEQARNDSSGQYVKVKTTSKPSWVNAILPMILGEINGPCFIKGNLDQGSFSIREGFSQSSNIYNSGSGILMFIGV